MAGSNSKVIYDKRMMADQKRFEEQCFLLDHWFYLMPLSQAWKSGRWPNITLLEGNPYNTIHSLFSVKNLNPLITLTPLEIAALQPRVRILKVVECSDKGGTTKKILKEIPFKNHTEKTTLDGILQTNIGRGDQVGLKGFSYKLIGTTHGAEEKNILCDLKIVFKNLKDIFAVNTYPSPDAKTECEKAGASFKDLIIYPPTKTSALTSDVDPFEIKVHVGFADPAIAFRHMDIKPERKKELTRIIRMMNDTLSLTLVEHEFDFRQDGSAELSITYQGAFESRLTSNSSDIFQPSTKEELELIDRLKKELHSLNKERSDVSSQTKQGDDPSKSTKKKIKDTDKAIEATKEKLRTALNRDLQTKYSKLLDHMTSRVRIFPLIASAWMFGRNTSDGGWKSKGRIAFPGGGIFHDIEQGTFWSLPITPGASVGAGAAGAASAIEWKNWMATINASLSAAAAESDESKRQKIFDKLKNRRKGKAGTGDKTFDPGGKQSGKEKATGSLANQWTQKFKDTLVGGDISFHFFYLGDLLSAALDGMGFNGDAIAQQRYPNFRVLLGNILFTDPISGMEIEGGINLAHVPVSLNLFRAWFVENVVRKQISVYPFQKFMRDLIRGLVLPALGENCNVGQGLPAGSRVFAQHIAAPKGVKPGPGQRPFDRIPQGEYYNGQVKIPSAVSGRFGIKNIDPNSIAITNFHDINKDIMNYVYISSVGNTHIGREGNRKKDYDVGILHLNVGAPNGLLKKATFSRVELENLVELRSEEALRNNDNPLQIQRVYDCDLTLVGNSLFKPGMMVFVNPTMAGGGNPKAKNSISRQLGIGGYYFILEVENIIEPGVYETVLKTKFLGLGKVPGRNAITSAAAAEAIQTMKVEVSAAAKAFGKMAKQMEEIHNTLFGKKTGYDHHLGAGGLGQGVDLNNYGPAGQIGISEDAGDFP